jgi:hypothetical protein
MDPIESGSKSRSGGIHNTATYVPSSIVTEEAGRPGRPVPPPRPAQSRSAPGSRPAPPAPPSYNIRMLTPPSRVADPYSFGPPGSVSQRYGSGTGYFNHQEK